MAQAERHLPIPHNIAEDESAVELLRVWMSQSGVAVTLRADGLPAEAWGLILVDVAKHAATAHARQGDGSSEAIFSRIVAILMAEIQQPTDVVQSM